MQAIKNARMWSLFFAGLTLRVLPERIKGQHRVGDVALWISAFLKKK